MPRLTNADLGTLLESVNILNSDPSVESLPKRLFAAISNSVSYEIVGFDGWKRSGEYTGKLWYGPNDWVTPDLMEVFGAFASEHPLVVPLVIEDHPTSLKISDYLTRQQFRRTGLFNEFYKEVGISEQMISGLKISPESTVSCALCRSRRDFSERDRALFDLLQPHLVNAFRNARAMEQLIAERDYAASLTSLGIVVLDCELKLKYSNRVADRFLADFFPERGTEPLSEPLRKYLVTERENLEGRDYFEPADVFRRRRKNSELQVRAVFDLNLQEIRLLLQEAVSPQATDYLLLGLTNREAEILRWIAEGKTDDTIGQLCGISPRTVQKHVEHIMQKLNVETRTAAVRYAFDALGMFAGRK
jgi:DNA-binding CsgD family transcriptional regulator